MHLYYAHCVLGRRFSSIDNWALRDNQVSGLKNLGQAQQTQYAHTPDDHKNIVKFFKKNSPFIFL